MPRATTWIGDGSERPDSTAVSNPIDADRAPGTTVRAGDRLGVPLEGGRSEALVRERASATPSKHVPRPEPSPEGERAPRSSVSEKAAREVALDVPLRALQHWFASAVMHPHGVASAVEESASTRPGATSAGEEFRVPVMDVERVLLPSKSLTGIDRLAIYGDAYRARLVECLADDYPAVKYALGDDAFEALCLRYIARHPSTSPNLNAFGRHMAAFCRGEERPARRFEGDLAALEWAMVEVLHAPSAEKLDLATLATVPVDQWAGARFVPSEAVRVAEFAYPVNAYFQAFRTDEGPAVPAAAWSATAVFRDGATIWRMDLGRAMHALLMMLFGGTALGPALETLATAGQLTEGEGTQVMVWFRDWVGHGFFARVETD
jgi:hypothetical protein